MSKKYSFPVLLVLVMSSVVFFNNTALAFDVDNAAANEMTVQDSWEIYIFWVTLSVLILVAIVVGIIKISKMISRPRAKRVRKK